MQSLFSTSFRPVRQMAQANVSVTPGTTPPAATPAPTVVPAPIVAAPPAVVVQTPAPASTGVSPVVWIVGGLFLAGVVAYAVSNSSKGSRRSR